MWGTFRLPQIFLALTTTASLLSLFLPTTSLYQTRYQYPSRPEHTGTLNIQYRRRIPAKWPSLGTEPLAGGEAIVSQAPLQSRSLIEYFNDFDDIFPLSIARKHISPAKQRSKLLQTPLSQALDGRLRLGVLRQTSHGLKDCVTRPVSIHTLTTITNSLSTYISIRPRTHCPKHVRHILRQQEDWETNPDHASDACQNDPGTSQSRRIESAKGYGSFKGLEETSATAESATPRTAASSGSVDL
jgi:hypothetical protein